ncbi:TPA: hypothetical protein DCZ46_01415 [Candidatus Campbellbacteria bacterium]|nr:MAG: s23 ribosomal protein [Candidatus Campbellbacteria bacterium GW2011_OD1_34_28]KKP75257.1 MAG: S23 ribosomal protein [Candidatus Campbellbacteria bacterium GW2011_GWD2_35_24]KKP76182.1 MAG: s23 ribosomal protein [Candidatus Campbellbacteria bacterium GW2011_GWC2_35_28]KKP77371.1 MAG: S23 ribosomal protein [Candidatus Campbellbacteria bacterium GW2011_GWC1_35_31]KKP79300.1 MAG: S23 ribosomal protein [Candidatus Campbellbacteria bacterium GW2011_GWD1_35_49]HAP73912.1 hypothetical protein 
MRDFKKLIVWQKAILLARKVYFFTEKLPDDEKFGLKSQVRRCVVSIPSNISEGAKRSTDKDFRNFINITSGSAAELETQLLLIKDIYKLYDEEVNLLLLEIQKMLESLIKKL